MSYQVLARKWRPRSFREMVGQTHVLKALINALDHQRLHHAYLFTGTRGVGKTTIARIMAKCLNCEEGVSSTPCGVCSICREIDEGRFIDLIEVDAASKTKVEDTREMLDNVQYMPTRGRYKVYLIDEVHMLSTSSFNALLKTLEEPPPYVKFLLATTDPQKLPATVLSRCLQFSLKNMPPEPIVGHLQNVLTSENIPFEDDALWLLGRAADGSMRDAMSLTDQAVSFGDGSVMADDVRAMLGTLDQGQIYGVLKALIAGDARAALSAVAHLAEHGPDWAGVLAEILNALHRIAIAQLMPDAIDNGQGDREQVLELAVLLPAEDVQFYYQLGLLGRRDLPLAPDPRDGFEMVLLRMLAFRPASLPGTAPSTPLIQPTAVAPSASPDSVGQQTSAPTASAVAPVAVVSAPVIAAQQNTEVQVTAPVSAAPESVAYSPVNTVEHIHAPWEEPLESAPVVTEPTPMTSAAEPEAIVAPADAAAALQQDNPVRDSNDADPQFEPNYEQDYGQAFAAEGDDDEAYLDTSNFQDYADLSAISSHDAASVQVGGHVEDLQPNIPVATGLAAEWQKIFLQLSLAGMTHSIAANTVLIEKNADTWLLHLDPNHSALFNKTQQQRINDAINAQLAAPIELLIELHAPNEETPALALLRQQAKRQQEAEAAIHSDPIVLQLMDTFGAIISANSIEPIDTLM
ncbi:DNA polymerase III subunit gamma/tau [Denitrificimonas caeni]|uniref:DNA polymerase III subunit gamma/tau n=1 Tax=Denitrificimonas caeni TaxID=521720 RepID=UPI0019665EE8|nr:DNA polymerase III subunit gamma/tau [Denitrificimonas caeni]